jgi:hypothetical protein
MTQKAEDAIRISAVTFLDNMNCVFMYRVKWGAFFSR